ncbi:hypothetical protein [Marinitoga lauensis]|uniref:hypothetical protein n=1 Tax=Marinitoga lauensis TaxID=2201189 RepID=UPI0010139AE0|nr:hypothetical protein [Marinitoga lauensis]
MKLQELILLKNDYMREIKTVEEEISTLFRISTGISNEEIETLVSKLEKLIFKKKEIESKILEVNSKSEVIFNDKKYKLVDLIKMMEGYEVFINELDKVKVKLINYIEDKKDELRYKRDDEHVNMKEINEMIEQQKKNINEISEKIKKYKKEKRNIQKVVEKNNWTIEVDYE